MRLPRPQISLKHLLFAVAIVAMNCAAYRYLFGELGRDGTGSVLGIVSEDFIVGVIPLLNVVMIGSALGVVRRLRTPRCGRQFRLHSRPAGTTFFSLHFLAICCAAAAFMPEAIEIEQVAEVIPQAWLEALREWARAFPDAMLECAILGLWYSGPPLLLSWIGGLLANHCAATLSARRFKALAVTVSFGFATVALAVCVAPRPFADDRDVDLDFRIVDNESTQPIVGATLRLTDAFHPFVITACALTSANGRARLTDRLPARGAKSAFQTFGSFSPWGRWLEVAAPGYRTALVPLPEALGPHVDLCQSRIHRVLLTKGTSPPAPFADVAGDYFWPGGQDAGALFRIAPDGRFDYFMGPLESGAYGRLRRNRDTLELIPTPLPGVEMNPLMAKKFRKIQWGECVYFIVAHDANLTVFLPVSLKPKHPPDYGALPNYRLSDHRKPRTGLSRLPAGVWLKFVLQEASLQNKDGLLRLGIERVLRGRTHPGTPRTDL